MGLRVNDINDDRCVRKTGEISVWISIGGCSPFTGERIPIDVLIARRRSNVTPSLRDNFHVRSNGVPFSIIRILPWRQQHRVNVGQVK